jgi:hypothetical protein
MSMDFSTKHFHCYGMYPHFQKYQRGHFTVTIILYTFFGRFVATDFSEEIATSSACELAEQAKYAWK